MRDALYKWVKEFDYESTPIERMDLIELSKAVKEVELVDELESDNVSFVRILWVNISGQHRCRVSFLYFVSFI